MSGQRPPVSLWVEGIRDDDTLTPTAKLCAFVLSTFMNYWTLETKTFASTVAAGMGSTERTMFAGRSRLVAAGWLEIVSGGGGRQVATTVRGVVKHETARTVTTPNSDAAFSVSSEKPRRSERKPRSSASQTTNGASHAREHYEHVEHRGGDDDWDREATPAALHAIAEAKKAVAS